MKRRLSSRPAREVLETMDELTAAAAVLAMENESDAEEDVNLEAASDTQDGREEQRPAFKPLASVR